MEKTVGPDREESLEVVPDVNKPFHDILMTEIIDSVQAVEEFKGGVNKEWLESICY